MFVHWPKVRSLQDWLMPLDGCIQCGYPFEREPGYFLLSIFAINYGVGALVGLAIYLILEFWIKLPIFVVLFFTVLPIPLFNLWFARHSKALFIAFDLFFDPHRKDDDRGDQPVLSNSPSPDPKYPDLEPVGKGSKGSGWSG